MVKPKKYQMFSGLCNIWRTLIVNTIFYAEKNAKISFLLVLCYRANYDHFLKVYKVDFKVS